MRKLTLKRIPSQPASSVLDRVEPDESDLGELRKRFNLDVVPIAIMNSKKAMFFTLKSDDIDECTLNNVRKGIQKHLEKLGAGDIQPIVLAIGQNDSFEVYETES